MWVSETCSEQRRLPTRLKPAFHPWDPHGRKREQTLSSCPLTSRQVLWHVCTSQTKQIRGKKKRYDLLFSIFDLFEESPASLLPTDTAWEQTKRKGRPSDGALGTRQASEESTSTAQWSWPGPATGVEQTVRESRKQSSKHPAPSVDRYQPTQERPGPK